MELTTRQRYDAMQRAQTALRRKANFYANQGYQLDNQVQRLQADLIRENKLLGKHAWKVSTNHMGNGVSLTSTVQWNKMPELVALLNPDYHCQYDLGWEKCTRTFRREESSYEQVLATLHFSDGDVYLEFPSLSAAIKFVQEFDLVLDFTSLEQEVAQAAQRHVDAVALLDSAKLLRPEDHPLES